MVKVRRNRQRWKKWIAMLAVAATVTTSVQGMPVYTYASEVSASEANTGKVYYDGTYEGIGTGYKSATTKIAVTVKGDKIVKLETKSHGDTPGYYKNAQVILDQIVEKNSTEVDTVSGATYSSKGIIQAVEDGLSQAKAAMNDGFAGGNGTKEDPYQISNAKQLNYFATSVDEGETYEGKYVVLTKDISLSEKNFNAIGNKENSFNGSFDGQNHTIDGLTIKEDYAQEANVGLFEKLGNAAKVSNVKLTNVDIAVTGADVLRAGGVAGDTVAGNASVKPVIDSCSVEGTVEAKTTGAALCFAGGVLGRQMTNAYVVNTGTDTEVHSASTGGNNSAYAGGISGMAGGKTLVANCYATGNCKAEAPNSTNFGGMAGGIAGMQAGRQYNVYATGNMETTNNNSPHKWVGAIDGELTGSVADGYAVYGYYNTESVQKINNTALEAFQAVGTGTVSKVGTLENCEGFKKAYFSTTEFASTLNSNIAKVNKKLEEASITDVALQSWSVAGNKVALSGKVYEERQNGKIFASGTGTKEDPYLVSNEKQLRDFAASLAEDNDYFGTYVALANDIILSDQEWNPIGGSDYMFDGTFDGKGYTVSGIKMGTKEEPKEIGQDIYNGFFGLLGQHALVKDLHLSDVAMYTHREASSYLGGIAAYLYKGASVDGCSVSGELVNVADKGNNFAGGIAGFMYYGYIINSWTNAYVSSTTKGGAIAEAGGLVGLNNRGLIANNYTLGNVYGSANREEEGMASISTLVGVQAGALVNCYAMGDNETDDYSYYTGAVSGWVTGIGKAYCNFYNQNATMKIGTLTPDPIIAVGTVVSGGTNEEGEEYIGGLTYANDPMSQKDMQSEKLATQLNTTFKKFPIDITSWGLNADTALKEWSYDAEKQCVVVSDNAAKVTYEKPSVEFVDDEGDSVSYVDGTYYGRNKSKTATVQIKIVNNVVTDAGIIAGSAEDTEGIIAELLATQKVNAQGDVADAVKEALAKAELGDKTTYEAFDASKFNGGKGTKTEPYEIATEEQLRYLAESINADVNYYDVYFVQTADITLHGQWLPIGHGYQDGNVYPFAGNYDGNNYVVKGLTIGTKEEPANMFTAGFFGVTNKDNSLNNIDPLKNYVEIKNVKLRDISIYNKTEGQNYCGGLLGCGQQGIVIDNCSVTGKMSITTADSFCRAGGMAGYLLRGRVTNTWANVEVYGETNKSWVYAGGLVSSTNRATLVNCYALGDVTTNSAQGNKSAVGGLVGSNGGIMINCYARGNQTAMTPTTDIGGVTGRTTGIAVNYNCYFNADATQKNGNTLVSDVKAAGVDVSGCMNVGVEKKTKEEIGSKEFAEQLTVNMASSSAIDAEINAHLSTISLTHSNYYTGQPLNEWATKNGVVVFANDGEEVTPTESPEVTATAIAVTPAPVTKKPENPGGSQPSTPVQVVTAEPTQTPIVATQTPDTEDATAAPTGEPTGMPEKSAQPVITETPKATEQVTATPIITETPVVTKAPETAVPTATPSQAPDEIEIKDPDKLPGDDVKPGLTSLKGYTIKISKTTYNWTGKAIKPVVSIPGLKKGVDYEVTYKNNKNVGTAKIIVTGIGTYEGTLTKTFKITVTQGKTYTVNGIKYKVNKGKSKTVTVMGTTDKNIKNLTIKDTVKLGGITYKVTVIAKKAFANQKKLKKVIIGKNITTIEEKAFYNDTNLKQVVVKASNLSKVGKKAFAKTNKQIKFQNKTKNKNLKIKA